MLGNDNSLKERKDVEKYALSIIIPLLNNINPVWDPDKPIPGRPHWTNHHSTFLESICRPLWILPHIINNSKQNIYIKYKGNKILIQDWYKEALLSGTNPDLKSYWGEYKKYGQVSTEIAPLTLTLYFAKDKFWNDFSNKEKNMIANWLYKIAALTPIETHKNNHYWFPILINLSLKRLGLKYYKDIIKTNLENLDKFYMGNGWYYDGTIGRYDYYIPWSHHFYPMLWILVENPNEPYYNEIKDKYIGRTNKFLKYYPYFFDSNGLNIPWGRSLAYRFAASSIFPMAVYNGCDINPGLAKSINLKNINFYKNNGAPANNIVPPGVTYPSTQNVERYISSVSSYWFTKGFISLIMDENHIFWKSNIEKLPVEKNKFQYKINVEKLSMQINGEKNSGITLFNNSAYILIGGFGSTNEFYSKFVYNSRSGFGTSTKDLISSDNMISLMTTNSYSTTHLASHRGIFKNLGEKNNVFYSEHIPFSNDEKSVIKTALLPLDNGFHIRAHKITLSRPYYILEGGFSCGKKSDFQNVTINTDSITVITEAGTSFIKLYTTDNTIFQIKKIHPEAHILYPLAIYPVYVTKNAFPPGEYIFVAAFYFNTNTKTDVPIISQINKMSPNIEFLNKKRTKLNIILNDKNFIIDI